MIFSIYILLVLSTKRNNKKEEKKIKKLEKTPNISSSVHEIDPLCKNIITSDQIYEDINNYHNPENDEKIKTQETSFTKKIKNESDYPVEYMNNSIGFKLINKPIEKSNSGYYSNGNSNSYYETVLYDSTREKNKNELRNCELEDEEEDTLCTNAALNCAYCFLCIFGP